MAAYVFLEVKRGALKQGTHQLMGIPSDRIRPEMAKLLVQIGRK